MTEKKVTIAACLVLKNHGESIDGLIFVLASDEIGRYKVISILYAM